jgi:hypothetical protein
MAEGAVAVNCGGLIPNGYNGWLIYSAIEGAGRRRWLAYRYWRILGSRLRGSVYVGRMRCAWPEYYGGCANHTVVRKSYSDAGGASPTYCFTSSATIYTSFERPPISAKYPTPLHPTKVFPRIPQPTNINISTAGSSQHLPSNNYSLPTSPAHQCLL